jgi:hypothetical protein
MGVKIEVTASAIKAGKRRDPEFRPIAVAMKASGFTSVRVNPEEVDYVDGVAVKSFELPREAQDFIEKFDDGKSVKPFSFVLK